MYAVADPKILKGGGEGERQFISSVLIYRKCAQQNICLLHGKKVVFWREKNEPIGGGGGRPHPPPPFESANERMKAQNRCNR